MSSRFHNDTTSDEFSALERIPAAARFLTSRFQSGLRAGRDEPGAMRDHPVARTGAT